MEKVLIKFSYSLEAFKCSKLKYDFFLNFLFIIYYLLFLDNFLSLLICNKIYII